MGEIVNMIAGLAKVKLSDTLGDIHPVDTMGNFGKEFNYYFS